MLIKSCTVGFYFLASVLGNYSIFLSNSYAQVTIPKTAEPSRIHKRFEPFPTPKSKLPPLIPPNLEETSIDELHRVKFFLSGVLIEGSTVYKDSDFLPLYEGYLGTKIDLAKIHEIATRITKKYHNDGYILSKAIVESQQIKNGIVKIKAIEVYVDKIEIKTKNNFSKSP